MPIHGKISDTRDYSQIGFEYATAVVAGTIPACEWIIAACKRELKEREFPPEGFSFSPDVGNHICKFAEKMPHIIGRWASPTIILEPWQCFIFTTIFGWVDADGFRRFRKALIVIPRKNAKTTMGAIAGLYMLAADGEPGAQIFSAARSRSQARIVWKLAKDMVERLPGFRRKFGVEPGAHSITVPSTSAYFMPLSKDAKSLEGHNPHFWIADELHAHKTRDVFDALNQGTGARKQPLGLMITTEGDNPTGILAEQIHYAQQVLLGHHEDLSYFSMIYTIDEKDDWTTPLSWQKANPNLGVSVDIAELETLCKQAQTSTEAQSAFLTKRLNVRVGASHAFFNMLAWKTLCTDATLNLADFEGEECFVGVDLASKVDLVAIVRGFARDDMFYVFPQFYMPLESIQPGKPNYDFYIGWKRSGLISVCDGPKIKQALIEEDLLRDADRFQFRGIGVDSWQAERFIENLIEAGLPAFEVPQNVKRLSEPMKELEADILAGQIKHDGNPILSWCMGNVVARIDANDNVFPRKERIESKIDGAVALILCKDQQMRAEAVMTPRIGTVSA